eukprot:scaffold123914_cov37-Cyclotella_meneghiniana.AAC.1
MTSRLMLSCGAASQTPAPHVAVAGAPPSSPVSALALKRHSLHERDGTVSGVNSPINKCTDARPTPTRCIPFDPNLPTSMQIEPPNVSSLIMDVSSDTPRDTRPDISTTITPSPLDETEASNTTQPSRPPFPRRRNQKATSQSVLYLITRYSHSSALTCLIISDSKVLLCTRVRTWTTSIETRSS